MNASIIIERNEMSLRESKELIQRLVEKEIRPTGMRRNVDMITNFSLEQIGW
jgi:hypothetical protein